MLPWQQLLPDTPPPPPPPPQKKTTKKHQISSRFSWGTHLVKIHAWVKTVEHPQTLRPENFKCCHGNSGSRTPPKT